MLDSSATFSRARIVFLWYYSFEESKDEDLKYSEGWGYKETFLIYRVDTEDLSSDECLHPHALNISHNKRRKSCWIISGYSQTFIWLGAFSIRRSWDERFKSRRGVKIMLNGAFRDVRKDERIELNIKVNLFRLKGEQMFFKISAVDWL